MNPLDQLHDILPPTQINAWPPLMVWLLALLILLAIFGLAWWLRRRYQRGALLRQANQQLLQIDTSSADAIPALQQLLRRTALGRYPREAVAGLVDNDWYQFLDAHLDSSQQGQWRQLLGDPYAPPSAQNQDPDALYQHVALVLPAIARGEQRC